MVCHTNNQNKDHFVQALKSKFLYDIEDEEFYFLIPLWMQKYVKNEKRYRLINFICLLAVYKKLIGTGRVLGTSILRYEANPVPQNENGK